MRAYYRYTTKTERNAIMALLDKRDKHYRIVHLRQEMKSFTTTEIDNALRQQDELLPLFQIATSAIPKLNIPKMTVDYYASLVDYYKGTRLANLEPMTVQLYLLCYVFNRFQKLNDTILEALKKRTQNFYSQAKKVMRDNAAAQLTTIEKARKNVS